MATAITIRLPNALAAVVRAAAKAEGVSVNEYVVYVLAKASSNPAFADQDAARGAVRDYLAAAAAKAPGEVSRPAAGIERDKTNGLEDLAGSISKTEGRAERAAIQRAFGQVDEGL